MNFAVASLWPLDRVSSSAAQRLAFHTTCNFCGFSFRILGIQSSSLSDFLLGLCGFCGFGFSHPLHYQFMFPLARVPLGVPIFDPQPYQETSWDSEMDKPGMQRYLFGSEAASPEEHRNAVLSAPLSLCQATEVSEKSGCCTCFRIGTCWVQQDLSHLRNGSKPRNLQTRSSRQG